MKRWTIGAGLLALAAILLAGCNSGGVSAGPAAASESPSTSLDTTYANALPLRNQLLLGTLRLDETSQPLSAAQAAALLPLWQGIRGTMNSGASSQAETDALLRQIEAGLTAEQLASIRGWRLTQADLQEWGRDQGVSTGGENAAGGMGMGQGGGGEGLSAEQRAARQAERGGGAEERGGISRALVDAVITYLETRDSN